MVIDLFCYMILSGQVIDLSPLCQESAIVSPIAPEPTVSVEKFKFTPGEFFTGRLRNTLDVPVAEVRLYFESYDDAGQFLESGSFYADPPTIDPGGATNFKWFAHDDAARIQIVRIQWEPE
ncbi:MAG: FxLYD domain-containing protein [Prochlorotrichaceae cyanobacterium]|jgi:hypothetical protein